MAGNNILERVDKVIEDGKKVLAGARTPDPLNPPPMPPVKPAKDAVNHPAHYNREGAMECIEEMVLLFGIEEAKIFCKLNVFKYRTRAILKNGMEDMQKSDAYMRMYKELCDRTKPSEHSNL